MRYKKKEYGFNIVVETKIKEEYNKILFESGQQTKPEQTKYTEEALIIQAILDYSRDYGTEEYFTRKEIIDNHLFPKTR